MPGWDATNRRTTERCPPKAASCKARWPSSVLTGKFFWRLNSVKNSWKKCRVRLFRSYEHGERMRKGATFPLAFENVRSWPGQGHLLSQASPRWLLQALSRATRWLLSDHDDWPSAMGSFPENLSFFRVKNPKMTIKLGLNPSFHP